MSSAVAVPAAAGIPVTQRGLSTLGHRRDRPGGRRDPPRWGRLGVPGPGGGHPGHSHGHGHPGRDRPAPPGRGSAARPSPVAVVEWGPRRASGSSERPWPSSSRSASGRRRWSVVGPVGRPRLRPSAPVALERPRRSVVDPRPRPGRRARRRRSAGRGARVDGAPGHRDRAMPAGDRCRRSSEPAESASEFDWVAFTSANAVDRFVPLVGRPAPSRRRPGSRRSGGRPRAALERPAAGLPDLVPERSTAAGLADGSRPPPGAVGSSSSRRAGPRRRSASGLRGQGWEVAEVVAYRTVRRGPAPGRGGGGARRRRRGHLRCSPSAVGRLPAVARHRGAAARRCRRSWRASGRATATAARTAGLPVAVEPATASVDALVDVIAAHLGALAGALRAARAGHRLGPWRPPGFPQRRMRRLRPPALRRLVAEARLTVDDLVAPLFVREGIEEPVPIGSMPGHHQHTVTSLVAEAKRLASLGIPGLVLFGVPVPQGRRGVRARATPTGSSRWRWPSSRAVVGDQMVAHGRPCLDEYTDHGHCGIVQARRRRSTTTPRWRSTAEVAVAQAKAGARRGRALRDDGRPGGGDPDGARRRRLRRGRRSSPTRPSTPRPSTGRSATRST